MTEATAADHEWTIIAADQDGDTEDLRENEHAHLEHLLRQGVRELVGEHAKPDEYDILIDGTVQEDLSLTLVAAGLHNESEVLILPKNVSRG
jgi:hypothetical protein